MSWPLTPVAVVDAKNAYKLLCAGDFMVTVSYPYDVRIKPNEIGAIFKTRGHRVIPILRVVQK